MPVVQVTPEPGYLVVNIDGQRTRYPISSVIRVADIPTGLTYTQVEAISKLANLLSIVLKELINRGLLDESFLEGYDLEAITEAITAMGGDYYEPDISVA